MNVYFAAVKTITATDAGRKFTQILSWVESGEVVRIQKHGRTVARVNPEPVAMSGKQAARLFANWHPTKLDRAAADEIQANIRRARQQEANELADRLRRAH